VRPAGEDYSAKGVAQIGLGETATATERTGFATVYLFCSTPSRDPEWSFEAWSWIGQGREGSNEARPPMRKLRHFERQEKATLLPALWPRWRPPPEYKGLDTCVDEIGNTGKLASRTKTAVQCGKNRATTEGVFTQD